MNTDLTALRGMAEALWTLADGSRFELTGPIEIVEHIRKGIDRDWPYEEDVELIVKIGDQHYCITGQSDSYGTVRFEDAKRVKATTKTVTVYE